MRTFRPGRDLYAIGSNPEAAHLAGIPVDLRVFAAFALSGLIAGFAGVLWLSLYGSVDSTAGTGYEFEVDRGRRRRRRRDLRRQRQRARRGARGAAAQHDRELARGHQRVVVLGSGVPGRAADRRDRVRPPRSACGWRPPCGHGGARVPEAHAGPVRSLQRLMRWESALVMLLLGTIVLGDQLSPAFLQVGQLLLPRPQHRRGRDHRAAARPDRDHGRDRPLGRLDARPVRARSWRTSRRTA